MALPDRHSEFARILSDVFLEAGWDVLLEVPVGDRQADLLADAGGRQYLVELKQLSEGRRDRLIPLLAQAILQSKIAAEKCARPTLPVAVVASSRIPVAVAEEARRFAESHAPEVGAGVIDAEGLRVFTGHGLERFDARPNRRVRDYVASRPKLPQLFSDLNQWMLKILIGQGLPQPLLSVPKGELRNASQLAATANVSTMSAFRLVQRLKGEGFLDESQDHLGLVRIEDLLERWVSANRQAIREIRARWIIKRSNEQLRASLVEYTRGGNGRSEGIGAKKSAIARPRVRCCLGLFAAADALGFGFVRGVAPHIYMEELDPDVLRRLGLTADDSTTSPDVFVRAPANREAVFRAAATADGVPVSDVLQTWLDVSTHPGRGREQADVIRKSALGPLLSQRNDDGRHF